MTDQPLMNNETHTQAALDVLAERGRQKAIEGWTLEHDDDRRRNLVRAGALILAVIERLDRAATQSKE
jgi:hypothetical protein